MVEGIHLWRWRYTNEFGKRVESSWRMSEDTVREYGHVYKDAEKIEGTLEIRKPSCSTSDWQR